MSLRLLFWLKAKLVWRALTAGGRWAAVLGPIALVAALSPLVFAGSWFAWHAEVMLGDHAFTVVFGLSLAAWLALAIGLNTLGTSLDPARVLRYPIAAHRLFAFETLAALIEPVALACLVPPAVLVVATFTRHGAAAGGPALLGLALLALTGAALLQLLVVALDRLLRQEWARVFAGLLLSGMFLLAQWSSRHLSAELLGSLTRGKGAAADRVLALARALEWFWPAALPARLAAWGSGGGAASALTGLLGSGALAWLAAWLGTRGLARNALREASVSRARPGVRAGRDLDAFAWIGAGLPPDVALLARTTARQWVRSPRGLFTLLFVPSLLALYYLAMPSEGIDPTYMGLTMALASIAQGTTLLYSHLGPGVRTLYLLPLRPRAIVLSQNALYLAQIALLGVVLVALYARTGHGVLTAARLPWLLVGLGCALALLGAGNVWSVRFPVRMPRGFSGARHGDWRPGLAQVGVLAASAAFGAAVVGGVRFLAPAPWRAGAAVAAAAGTVLLGALAAWFGVAAATRLWTRERERLIEVLAKDEV